MEISSAKLKKAYFFSYWIAAGSENTRASYGGNPSRNSYYIAGALLAFVPKIKSISYIRTSFKTWGKWIRFQTGIRLRQNVRTTTNNETSRRRMNMWVMHARVQDLVSLEKTWWRPSNGSLEVGQKTTSLLRRTGEIFVGSRYAHAMEITNR